MDGVLQQQPGGKDLLRNAHSPDEQVSAILTATGVSGTDPLEPINGLNNYAYPACIENSSCLPAYYKEQVGLKRSDRFIPTIGYERETDIGVLVAGITSNSPANSINKDTTIKENEIFIGYALPFLPSLVLEAYVDWDTTDDYFMLTYANEIELADWMSLEYDVHVGYAVQSHLQGVQDVTANLRYNVYGFFVGVTCAYRPDLRFHEGDKTVGSDHLPYWLLGQSSRGDGLVTDPARSYGLVEQYINSVIDDFLRGTSGLSTYQFAPRQKLPRVIWAANIGYAFSL
ncbi:MAG: hypothetical protein KDK30_12940 [Leptospiraceae bacterium]|nr:hypothetical protein [Leptospiraceae bacterium]